GHRLGSNWAPIAHRLQTDCAPIANRLRTCWAPIARLWRTDLRIDCAPIVHRLRTDSAPISQHMYYVLRTPTSTVIDHGSAAFSKLGQHSFRCPLILLDRPTHTRVYLAPDVTPLLGDSTGCRTNPRMPSKYSKTPTQRLGQTGPLASLLHSECSVQRGTDARVFTPPVIAHPFRDVKRNLFIGSLESCLNLMHIC
ncbi:hypothetical protein LSAT2_026200, partial [Lamellibrachia satsuma]